MALEKQLLTHPQISVFLTRRKDRFVSLENRTVFAKQNNGDIFVSLHANAHRSSKVRGVTTYFLSTTKNQATLSLASRENQMKPQGLKALFPILQDLLQTVPTSRLSALARNIHVNMETLLWT